MTLQITLILYKFEMELIHMVFSAVISRSGQVNLNIYRISQYLQMHIYTIQIEMTL